MIQTKFNKSLDDVDYLSCMEMLDVGDKIIPQHVCNLLFPLDIPNNPPMDPPASARTDGCLLRLLWRCQNLSLCSYILLSPLRQIIPYNLCYIDWKQMMPSQSINCWGPNHYAEWSLNCCQQVLFIRFVFHEL